MTPKNKSKVAFYALIAAFTALATRAQTASLPTSLAEFASPTCEGEVQHFLEQQTIDLTPVNQIRTETEGLVQAFPAKSFGTWLEKHRYADGHLEVWKVSQDARVTYKWNSSDCKMKTVTADREQNESESDPFPMRETSVVPSFTDKDMARLLKKTPRGLVYLWSPKMPLSVTGLQTMTDLAKVYHLPITFLVDPNLTDVDYREVKNHAPKTATARATSYGLNYVAMTMHYPSLLFYDGGKLNPWPAMGYRGVEGYDKVISEWTHAHDAGRGLAVAPKSGVPDDDTPDPSVQMAELITVKNIKAIPLPQAFGFFVKPVWGTRWVGLHHDWATSYFYNLDSGVLADLGVTNDTYVTPTDHLYSTFWATKGADGGGKLGIRETSEFMKLVDDSHYAPKDLLIDDKIKADYQCVGTLDGGGKEIGHYRVLTGGYKNRLTFRDYEIKPAKGRSPATVTPIAPTTDDAGVLCKSVVGDKNFATPMLSKDGRFVGVSVGRGKDSSHIFHVKDNPEDCDDVVTFKSGTSKVAFSFDNKLVAFAQRGQAYVYNIPKAKLYKVDGVKEKIGTGQFHFPEFREDGTLLAPYVLSDGSMEIIEFSLPQ